MKLPVRNAPRLCFCFQSILSLEYCLGIIGGKPKQACYFVGFQGQCELTMQNRERRARKLVVDSRLFLHIAPSLWKETKQVNAFVFTCGVGGGGGGEVVDVRGWGVTGAKQGSLHSLGPISASPIHHK